MNKLVYINKKIMCKYIPLITTQGEYIKMKIALFQLSILHFCY